MGELKYAWIEDIRRFAMFRSNGDGFLFTSLERIPKAGENSRPFERILQCSFFLNTTSC